jgi:hypothetical protein
MDKHQQISDFLSRYVTGFPRCHGPFRVSLGPDGMWGQPRPSAEDLANNFLRIAEFRALQLGTWLGTTDGGLIMQAVELVVPMYYVEDVALITEALKLAARTQQQEGVHKALAGAAVGLFTSALGYVVARANVA